VCEPPSAEPQRSLSLVAEMAAEVKADPGAASVVPAQQARLAESEFLLQQRWLHATVNIGDISPVAGDMSEVLAGSPSFMFLKSEPMALKMEERLARNPYFIRTPPQLRRNEHGIAAAMSYDCMEEDDGVWF